MRRGILYGFISLVFVAALFGTVSAQLSVSGTPQKTVIDVG